MTGPAEPHKVYLGLRGQLLSASPAALGLGPTADLPHVWAVLMDLAVREHHATLVAVADGTTSLYTSVGGGMLGAGELPAVGEAASRLLHVAERELDEIPPADGAPLPPPAHVAFVVLTHAGSRRVEVTERDAMALPGVAHDLYMAAQAVVTQLRLADTTRA